MFHNPLHVKPTAPPLDDVELPIRATYRTVARLVEKFTTQERWNFFQVLAQILCADVHYLQARVEIGVLKESATKDLTPAVQETLALLDGWKLVKLLTLIDTYCVDLLTDAPCCYLPEAMSPRILDCPPEWLWGTTVDYQPRLHWALEQGGGIVIPEITTLLHGLEASAIRACLESKIRAYLDTTDDTPDALWVLLLPQLDLFLIAGISPVLRLVSSVYGMRMGKSLSETLLDDECCCHPVEVDRYLAMVRVSAYLGGHPLLVMPD